MPTLTIDGRPVEVPPGATLLDAARKLGLDVPTLCHLEGYAPSTSCFVCVVKVKGRPGLVPSCATVAAEGMEVESETEEVREARRTALELLLSDHLGDCVGPCHSLCPANMNIPLMIRQIAAGEMREAIVTVKARIALPAVLGRICPAPCEKGCRRAAHDAPLSICLLKRYVADIDLASGSWLPACEPASGRRVAVVGAGPAGLAAAWQLLQMGHGVTVFDDHPKPGGMLQYGVPEERLPRAVVDAEAGVVARLGADFRLGARVESVVDLRRDFDAVLVATGELKGGESLGLDATLQGIKADRQTYATARDGVFAAGGALRALRMAVRACADGRGAAESIGQFLAGHPVAGPRKLFTVRIGKLEEGEIGLFMEGVSGAARVEPAGDGFAEAEARAEALRCLHCDCRKPVACRLRRYAAACEASPSRFKAARRRFEHQATHPDILYEVGKCIDCGLCIQIAEAAGEELGLSFVGRGFDVRVSVPFSRTIAEGLRRAAAQCAAACPTGAIALRNQDELDR